MVGKNLYSKTRGFLNGRLGYLGYYSSISSDCEKSPCFCRYPVTLFNELYYLNAGGTIWTGIPNLLF